MKRGKKRARMFQGSVLATSEGSHAKTGGSGKAMPQFDTAAADNTHRFAAAAAVVARFSSPPRSPAPAAV